MIKLFLDTNRLENAMLASGETISTVSKHIGVTRSAVSGWKGGSGISYDHLIVLSEKLRVSPKTILSGKTLEKIESIRLESPESA
jgi:transcriptional regulator with XRE-family HTH domain